MIFWTLEKPLSVVAPVRASVPAFTVIWLPRSAPSRVTVPVVSTTTPAPRAAPAALQVPFSVVPEMLISVEDRDAPVISREPPVEVSLPEISPAARAPLLVTAPEMLSAVSVPLLVTAPEIVSAVSVPLLVTSQATSSVTFRAAPVFTATEAVPPMALRFRVPPFTVISPVQSAPRVSTVAVPVSFFTREPAPAMEPVPAFSSSVVEISRAAPWATFTVPAAMLAVPERSRVPSFTFTVTPVPVPLTPTAVASTPAPTLSMEVRAPIVAVALSATSTLLKSMKVTPERSWVSVNTSVLSPVITELVWLVL